ncbi:hypothetical protein F4553_008025 [Allocatelliglobosispora scoriae]|uniref:Uncharacterized protein n=1 Tax=Allocatelliglobosispora scoriae TaxID=643052 RepID=A0A841C729_9ACTN|nr:hypothetical protein [Allocatelliglobosispora scoriae]
MTSVWRIDAFRSTEVVADGELTYISMFAAWLVYKHPGRKVLVNGVTDSPILKMSRVDDSAISFLENHGYS